VGQWLLADGDRPVAYVYSAEDYVQFGFFNGSSLKDPKGLLEGKGQYVRHTKVRRASKIDERALGGAPQAGRRLALKRARNAG
jgi:hypothetical protein